MSYKLKPSDVRALRCQRWSGMFHLSDLGVSKGATERMLELGLIYKPKPIGIRKLGAGEYCLTKAGKLICGDPPLLG